jgi:hypothetical protein
MAVVLPRIHPLRGDRLGAGLAGAMRAGRTSRPLRVALDRSSVVAGPALDLVLELGREGLAEIWSTEPEGVDATISIETRSASDDSIPVFIDHRNGRRTWARVWPMHQWERDIEAHATTTGQTRAVVEARFLVAAALMDRVDALIVGDLDFGRASRLAAQANPMSPETACALLGLVARLNEDFTIAPVSRTFFYLLLARGLLPAGWRWFSACVNSSHETGDDFLLNVGQSGHERVGRAIMSRDRCLGNALDLTSADAEETAYYFDAELLMLSSALDSVAQVAHVAHAVHEDARNVGWRRARWRKALRRSANALWLMTEPATPERDAIDLVALLRNTIHGEGMRVVTVGGREPARSQLTISSEVASALASILDRHGGASAWGLVPGVYPLLDPSPFAQRIVPLVAQSMNALMAGTEVERLTGAARQRLLHGPPDTNEIFRPDLTHRLLLLAGLTP